VSGVAAKGLHRALARDGSFAAARVPTRAAAPTRRGHPVDWRGTPAAVVWGSEKPSKSRVNSSQTVYNTKGTHAHTQRELI